MSDKKTLSVIIPAYNCEKTIAQTIDSILEQQCKDIEIVIIDDGSTDSTANICKEYCSNHSFIRYYYKENTGVSRTRNLGIEKAKGTYIAFIDSDDIWDKEYYDNQLNEKLKSEEYDVLAFSSCFSDMDLNITEYVKVEDEILVDKKDEAVDKFYHSFSSFIYKLDLIKENDLYFCTKLKYGEDELFRSKCLYMAHKIWAQDKLSFYYRNNINSATKVNRRQKLFAKQKLKTYYLMKEFFYNQYKKEGSELVVKNATTAKYLVEAIRLLSETGYGYIKVKKICQEENIQLIKDNIGKHYQMYYKHTDILNDYLKSAFIAYTKRRIFGLCYYTAVGFKHWLIRLKNKIVK